MVTRQQIARDLNALGIQPGDTVFFHSSMRSLGWVEGGPEAVIQAFLDAVGPEGTVAVPTIIRSYLGPRDPFDPDFSPSEAGLLTETLRKWPGARRSWNPTHSVAAIGHRAEELCQPHLPDPRRETLWGDTAFSSESAWEKLYQWNAQYLLLGVDFNYCSIFHYVQARYVERHQPDYARQIGFPDFDFFQTGEKLFARGLAKTGKVGEASAILIGSRDLVDHSLDLLEQTPDELQLGAAFAHWVNHVKGRSLTLRGAFAATDLNIPGWMQTLDGTPLKGRLFYVEDEREKFLIVSLTIIGLTPPDAWRMRVEIGQAVGLEPAQIMIVPSHVHTGPPLLGRDGIDDQALPAMIEDCVAAARVAISRAEPIRLGVAQRQVEGVSRIRRIMTADGRTITIRRATPSTWHRTGRPKGWDGPFWLKPESEINDTLTVLRVENAAGKPIGCLFNFACHPLPDFIGFGAALVERVMGGDFVCAITNGALGDVDVPFEIPRRGKVRDGQLPWLGEVFGYSILETLARADVEDGGSLSSAREEVFFPLNPRIREIEAGINVDGLAHCKPKGYRYLEQYLRDGGIHAEIQTLRLGPLTLVGIPGELANSIGQAIVAATPLSPACIAGLANGEAGYLISAAAQQRGGYEADTRMWCHVDSQFDPILRAAAQRCLQAMEKKNLSDKRA